uniref:Integrase catalytic domain-containing protein n=1 Tax=Latimeria chalumnae TaxID=7897 RepID=H2ZTL0_LATCH
MSAQVDVCKHCIPCAQINAPHKSIKGLLPLRTMPGPWQRIFIDYIEGLPRTPGGATYALVIVDAFSKWVEVFPVTNANAVTTAKKLLTVCASHGIPEAIESDRGSHFDNQVMRVFLQALGIHHHLHIPYRPQASGQVEHMNRTLKSALKKMCVDNGRNWAENLPAVLMAVRSRPLPGIGYSPFEIMTGRSMNLPENLLLAPPLAWEHSLIIQSKFVEQVMKVIREMHMKVGQGLGVRNEKAKFYYDQKSDCREYQVGESNKGIFPQAAYEGPGSVVDKVSPTVYAVHLPFKGKYTTKYYHIMQLKP